MDRAQQSAQLRSEYAKELASHRHWCESCPQWYRRDWSRRLEDPDSCEAAIFEACVRELLSQNGQRPEPADKPGKGGPDFRCTQAQYEFYVEATTIRVDTVTEKTCLPHRDAWCGYYRNLSQAISEKCVEKTEQCKKVGHPTVLAVGTLHENASAVCFRKEAAETILTGVAHIRSHFNPTTGGQKPATDHQVSGLHYSAFLYAPEGDRTEESHRSISAVLLCGFATQSIYGTLNPNPLHRFERQYLPEVPFCQLSGDWQGGDLAVEWFEPNTQPSV